MTAPEDQNGLREALARDIADVLLEGGALSPLAFARHLLRPTGPLASLIAERDADRVSLRAAEAEITRLKEGMEARDAALRPFAAGGPWGGWLSWLINGAPDREQGKAAAKQIVHWRAAVDVVLSPKEHPHG